MDPRYARHLLLPEVGPAGQARLCAHAVSVPDTPAGRVAAAYLERAGVHVVPGDDSPQRAQRAQRKNENSPSAFSAPSAVKIPANDVATLAAHPDLAEAAAWLSGAFAAVEEIKRALNVGEPGSLEGVRLTGPQDEDDDR